MEQNTNLTEEQLDSYIEDAFTYSEGELDLEVDSLDVKCINSKYDNFSLDENGNLAINSISFTGGQSGNGICDLIYPIGSIYLSVGTINPSVLFGGTWEQITNRFLVGASTIYTLNSTGGAASVTSGASSGNTGGPSTNLTGSTTLTIDQIPSHSHALPYSGHDVQANSSGKTVPRVNYDGHTHNTYATGGGQGHTHTLNNHTHSLNSHTHSVNTMPPYLAVNIWKRTA